MYAPISRERAEADRRMIDAIRESFGMAPLYAKDPKERRTEEQRFWIDTAPATESMDFVPLAVGRRRPRMG